jgi:hypothetical protein
MNFPRSESRNVPSTAHLLSFSERLVGELGKRWVGSACQIHVAVRQGAVGSRIARALGRSEGVVGGTVVHHDDFRVRPSLVQRRFHR